VVMVFNPDKLAKLQAKSSSAKARTGGKGTVRRKHKAVRKAAIHDDKRLKSTLNRLNVRDIPAIEEVNLFKEDGQVIHFVNPKVQASIAANTYVVSGNAETKKLQDLLPGIITQLGPDNLEYLKKVYASYGEKLTPGSKATATPAGPGGPSAGSVEGADDDEVPDLVESFEDVSKQAQQPASTTATTSTDAPTSTDISALKDDPKGDNSSESIPKEEGTKNKKEKKGKKRTRQQEQ